MITKRSSPAITAEEAGRLVRITKRRSQAVAAEEAGRLVRINKRSSFFPMSKEMALAGRRYKLLQQEDRPMDEIDQLDSPKEAASNERYRLQGPEEMDEKYQLKDMNSAFLIHMPAGRNSVARKRAIRRSCWFQYYTKCPRETSSPRSLQSSSSRSIKSSSPTRIQSSSPSRIQSSSPRSFPQEESSFSGFTDSKITQRAVLQALGF